jgi:hypothetical protein
MSRISISPWGMCVSAIIRSLPQRSHTIRRNHDGNARRGSIEGFRPRRQRVVAVAAPVTSRDRPGRHQESSALLGSQWCGQRLQAGDRPGAGPRLQGVGDARKPPPQLEHGRKFSALIEGGADRGSICLGNDEHLPSMGRRTTTGKWVTRRICRQLLLMMGSHDTMAAC